MKAISQCDGNIDGVPEADVLLNRAWLPITTANRRKLICNEHRELLTKYFASKLMKGQRKCLYSGHDLNNPRQQKDVRKVTYAQSQHELRTNKAYAPFKLATCKTCSDAINALKTAPMKAKVVKEPKPQPSASLASSDPVLEIEAQPSVDLPDVPEPMDCQPSTSKQMPLSSTQKSDISDSQSLPSQKDDPNKDPDFEPQDDDEDAHAIQTPSIQTMNLLLEQEGMKSRAEHRLLKDFDESDESRQNKLKNIMADHIVAGLKALTPKELSRVQLWQSILKSGKVEQRLKKKIMPEPVKNAIAYLKKYNAPDDWTRIIASLVELGYGWKDLRQWNNPNQGPTSEGAENSVASDDDDDQQEQSHEYWPTRLTKTKFTNGKQHYLLNGHAMCPVSKLHVTRRRVKDEILTEIYRYVMSNEITKRVAFGAKSVKTSQGTVFKVAKNIRNFTTNELVRKIIGHLRSLDHIDEEDIPSHSFIRDCLTGALPATKSKKMKGVTPAVEYGKSFSYVFLILFS